MARTHPQPVCRQDSTRVEAGWAWHDTPLLTRRCALWLGTALIPWPGTSARAATPVWPGPTQGPRAAPGRRITVLAEDLRNGGVLGVAQGLREAARELKWSLRVIDAGGHADGRRQALKQAMGEAADGFAVCGSDARQFDADCRELGGRPPPAVGWHVADAPGALGGSRIATNVSTDPLEVARVAAAAARPAPGRHCGAVIVTDSRFGIATTKSRAMEQALRAAERSTVLEVVDVPISRSLELTPALVRRLAAQHGPRWTHLLAINDIYFDHAVPVLTALGRAARHVELISAGDGSASALVRVHAGSFQTGTVAEPLNLQGWQMADELNRLLAGEPVSGFVTPATLVTRETLARASEPPHAFDPGTGYREAYRRIWFGPAPR